MNSRANETSELLFIVSKADVYTIPVSAAQLLDLQYIMNLPQSNFLNGPSV